ncbi:DivIVA domain-containing protein [Streptomyces roseolilacinus]
MAVAMVVVVAAVTLAVVGGAENEVLPEAPPEHVADPLPLTRPVSRFDIEALRLPLAPRGYRMNEVDDVLDRLAAELAERDARIAELESALAGAQATASGRTDLFAEHPRHDEPAGPGTHDDRHAYDDRDRGAYGGRGGDAYDDRDGDAYGAHEYGDRGHDRHDEHDEHGGHDGRGTRGGRDARDGEGDR